MDEQVDQEIEAMGTIASALRPLDDAAVARVLGWAHSRFNVTMPVNVLSQAGNSQAEDKRAIYFNEEEVAEQKTQGSAGVLTETDNSYTDFAELFDAAAPATDQDKLLVAAYWVSEYEGASTFGTQLLNKKLKDLGHPVGHISTRMDQLKQRKPGVILQTQKAGKTQQGRKTYKLTQHATKVLKAMTTNGD